jgi:aspartate aminotransferase-like enzyme
VRQYLLIPGPTPLPDEVLQASAKQMVNHRDPEFCRLLADTLAALRRVFQTRNTCCRSSRRGRAVSKTLVNVPPGDTARSWAARLAALPPSARPWVDRWSGWMWRG